MEQYHSKYLGDNKDKGSAGVPPAGHHAQRSLLNRNSDNWDCHFRARVCRSEFRFVLLLFTILCILLPLLVMSVLSELQLEREKCARTACSLSPQTIGCNVLQKHSRLIHNKVVLITLLIKISRFIC
jgi:hypothetical protein